MPSRHHRALRQPPSITDRVLSNPWSLTVVAGVWTVFGLMLCWTWLDPGAGPSVVLPTLPEPVAGAIAVMLFAGGACMMAANLWSGRDSTSWGFELVGLPLGASAWAAYGLATALNGGIWWPILAAAYLGGSIVRFVAAVINRRDPQGVLVIDGRVHTPE